MAELRLQGFPASPGFAAGVLRALPTAAPAGAALAPSSAAGLRSAIAAALADLEALQATCSEAEREFVGAQIALLGDDEIARAAYEAIEGGHDAAAAWRAALDEEIAGYLASEDAFFRARAADFEDIRDRVLDRLAGAAAGPLKIGAGTIVVASDLKPSQFLAAQWSAGSGVALAGGSPSSHVAMLARGRGVAMVVGLGERILAPGGQGLIDGNTGEAVLQPRPATIEASRRRSTAGAAAAADLHLAAATADGQSVQVLVNVAHPDELAALDPDACDGIGLVRTEMFVADLASLRDEERQLSAYAAILSWARGKPVTFRTIDAGGDKPIEGYTQPGETNPFLGLRGIRLSLLHPEIFRVQLRALARAAALGPLRVMLPMVADPSELAAARRLLAEEADALARDGVAHRVPPLGMMVEVPAAAIAVDLFDADFFSIGTNDLIQYVAAAGRDSAALGHLAGAAQPAVLRLVAAVAAHGRASARDVSLCGDAASDPAALPLLLAAGLRTLSVAPNMIGATKARIGQIDLAAPSPA